MLFLAVGVRSHHGVFSVHSPPYLLCIFLRTTGLLRGDTALYGGDSEVFAQFLEEIGEGEIRGMLEKAYPVPAGWIPTPATEVGTVAVLIIKAEAVGTATTRARSVLVPQTSGIYSERWEDRMPACPQWSIAL